MGSMRIRKTEALFALAALYALASGCSGCFGCTAPGVGDGGNLPSSCANQAPLVEAQKLDVLFVIDNSSSMKEEQEGVAQELTAFIDELKKGGGVSQDFNIGVITTAVYQHTNSGGIDFNRFYPGQMGLLQPVPLPNPDGGTPIEGTERFLNAKDPELIAKFARLVQQGTRGSGQETPFEAIRLAVTELDRTAIENGGNGGFLRDGARLLIVTLTDEDDCSEKAIYVNGDRQNSIVTVGENPLINYCGDQQNSLTTVAEYYDIFSKLKDSNGNTREVIYTAIAPVSTTNKSAMSTIMGGQVRNIDCPTSNQPGFRHRMMAEKFDPSLINLDSICKANYRETLLTIASLANISQTVEVRNIPDPNMLQVIVTRKDLTQQKCTLDNKGLDKFENNKAFFSNTCKRRSDDVKVELKLLCVN